MNKNNKSNDFIRALITVERIRFYNKDSNWGIIDFSVVQEFEGEVDPLATVAKGEMCKVAIGHQYFLTAEKVTDPKWGDQYEIKSLAANIKVDDRDGQRKYLESLFTPQQVEAMYEALEDPFNVLLSKSAVELCKVKGCQQKTALRWIDRFHDQYDKSRLYVELADYCLTESMMTKLLKKYNTVDLVIDKVKENPYQLCKDVDGIGFKTADEIALNGGLDEFSPVRIAAFIEYYLYNRGNEGKSYITSQELMDAIVEFCGDEVPDSNIGEAINENLKNQIWTNDDHSLIGLKLYYDLESEIAQLLIDLLKAEPTVQCPDNWEDSIHELENKQGWCYDVEQYQGIKTVLDNNVCIVTGLAGTGKSSIVAGVLKVLEGCTFSQCALAGKAAARLTEVTGEEGKTIHRLLEYGPEGFLREADNPLEEDIIIADEFSMIDGDLFVRLLRAIKPGTKLILLGDPGQLEAIGSCSIANDMIQSGEIPVVYLKTIHRQAGESGIIVESQNIYNGVQIVEKDFVGVLEKGSLKDLVLDCYSDKSNTYYKIMKYFSTLLEGVDDIMDLQILVPIKSNGDSCTWILNNSIQDLYNPNDINKNEIDVRYTNGKVGILREGDKVINVKNNYKTHKYIGEYDEDGEFQLYEEEYTPIYNGNLGIIRKINIEDEYAVIDFNSIGLIYISFETIKTIELAYAITGHKSQGSEFKYVIIGLDMSSYILLSKEWIYTAVTRAKKKCYLCAQTNALRHAIGNHSISSKQTFLQKRLHDIAHPKLVF